MTRFHRTLRLTWFLLFVGLGMVAAATAHAQPANCNPTDVSRNVLTEKYGERRIATGWASDESAVYEWWANEETQTWTILLTLPNGTSCVMADGKGHISWPPPPNV